MAAVGGSFKWDKGATKTYRYEHVTIRRWLQRDMYCIERQLPQYKLNQDFCSTVVKIVGLVLQDAWRRKSDGMYNVAVCAVVPGYLPNNGRRNTDSIEIQHISPSKTTQLS